MTARYLSQLTAHKLKTDAMQDRKFTSNQASHAALPKIHLPMYGKLRDYYCESSRSVAVVIGMVVVVAAALVAVALLAAAAAVEVLVVI